MGLLRFSLERILKRLSGFRRVEKRPLIEEVLEQAEEDLKNSLTPFYAIRAPTGYGKTTLSLALAEASLRDASWFEKVIHVLPLRTIVDDLFSSSKKVLGDWVGRQRMGAPESPFLTMPLTFVTVDTFVLAALKLNTAKIVRVREREEHGYDYFTQASVLLSAVVLDEAHIELEDPLLRRALGTVLRILARRGTPTFIMSATLTDGQVRELRKVSQLGRGCVFREFQVDLDDPEDEFVARERAKEFDISWVGRADPTELVDPNMRNLVVVNWVSRAQEVYRNLKATFGNDIPIEILHSRFTESDRERKVSAIRRLADEGDRWIVVSTQVIEAGVDISADLLVTDLAPPSALIQRMGRVARWRERSGVVKIVDPGGPWPYGEEIMKRAALAIKSARSSEGRLRIHPRLPPTYSEFLLRGEITSPLGCYDRLVRAALDPGFRAEHVLSEVGAQAERGGFLRGYPVPLEYDGEAIPIPARSLRRLVKDHPGSVVVEARGKTLDLNCDELAGMIVRAARWEDVRFRLTRADLYDREVGLRL